MDVFSKFLRYRLREEFYKGLFIILLCLLLPASVQAQDKGKVAVLPFMIQSLELMENLKVGLQQMLASFMLNEGYRVISSEVVNRNPAASADSLETGDIIALGKELEADWIIRGSLAQVGEKIILRRIDQPI